MLKRANRLIENGYCSAFPAKGPRFLALGVWLLARRRGNRDHLWVTGCPDCLIMRATMVAVGVSNCRGGFVSKCFLFIFLGGI